MALSPHCPDIIREALLNQGFDTAASLSNLDFEDLVDILPANASTEAQEQLNLLWKKLVGQQRRREKAPHHETNLRKVLVPPAVTQETDVPRTGPSLRGPKVVPSGVSVRTSPLHDSKGGLPLATSPDVRLDPRGKHLEALWLCFVDLGVDNKIWDANRMSSAESVAIVKGLFLEETQNKKCTAPRSEYVRPKTAYLTHGEAYIELGEESIP